MLKTGSPPEMRRAWTLLGLWISEIIADFWAMAHLGVGATLGLMSVVSLPRYFMFRVRGDDPHPFPWIRVELSLAFGERLYPHPQWQTMRAMWRRLYPPESLPPETDAIVRELLACLPRFTAMVIRHNNPHTRGKPLGAIFPVQARQPAVLKELYQRWIARPRLVPIDQPSLVFAVLGQARADTQISAPLEGRLLSQLLTRWALMRAENRTTRTAGQLRTRETNNIVNN
jgi:hypothetical protein